MTTFKNMQDEILTLLYGYGLDSPRFTSLAGAIDSTAVQFGVSSAAGLDQGVCEVDGELMFIESVDRANDVITLSADGRGWLGTTATDHASSARLSMAPAWPRQTVKRAINDAIISCYPTLFAVAQTSFTYSPAVSTYELPVGADRVVRVEATTVGPSRAPQVLTRWVFNSVAPTAGFSSTNTIELQEGVQPGQTVTVTYATVPTELSADTDDFTSCGLAATARLAVVYGACGQLLSFMDISRLRVDTARADDLDDKVQVGMAARLAGQMQIRFEMELAKEQRRLRQRVPVTFTMRKR